MENTADNLTNTFLNLATMATFPRIDAVALAAFCDDDHKVAAEAAAAWDVLICDIIANVPAANA